MSLSTCPLTSPLSPAHSFVPGPPVINIFIHGPGARLELERTEEEEVRAREEEEFIRIQWIL